MLTIMIFGADQARFSSLQEILSQCGAFAVNVPLNLLTAASGLFRCDAILNISADPLAEDSIQNAELWPLASVLIFHSLEQVLDWLTIKAQGRDYPVCLAAQDGISVPGKQSRHYH